MEIKDYVAITLSMLAFGLGVFNLWWGSFRRRIALFYIQGTGWSYALVNGGKTDILVVDMQYWFSGANANQSTQPVQGTDVPMPFLLKAGTAIYPSKSFPNQQDDFSLMARRGREIPENTRQKALTAVAHISWIDNNGEEHSSKVTAAEVMVDADTGFIRAWQPKTRRADLSPSRLRRGQKRKPLAAMLNG